MRSESREGSLIQMCAGSTTSEKLMGTLVPLACAIFTVNMLANVPFSADFSVWYMSTSILALLSVVALAGWGFYHSLGNEMLWRAEVE
jgi:hypothetical protein